MLLVSLLLNFAAASADNLRVIPRGEINIEKPAFLTLTPNSILVSSFKLWGIDHVFILPRDIVSLQNDPKTENLTDKIIWPNEVTPIDSTEFGEKGFIVTSGFLLPGKSTGAVTFLSDTGMMTKITKDKPGFFYHRAVFIGTDIITARSKIPLKGKPKGELVRLQRPTNPLQGMWPEKILAYGPDIHFRIFKDEKSKITFLIAAEFSNKRLQLYWFDQDENVFSRTIDSELGSPFDLELVDLNHDGRVDLLVTNHQHDSKAAVLTYELPNDLKTGVWIKHILLQGIQTRQKGFNQASPGAAKAFFPETANKTSKPWILVSGDGSQRVHMLVPKSENSKDWNYTENIILDAKSTVGEPLIFDFDGDGLSDFVIPAYDRNKIFLLSLKPEEYPISF